MDKVVTAEREKEAKITAATAEKKPAAKSPKRTSLKRQVKRLPNQRAQGEAEAVRVAAIAKADAIRAVNTAIEESFATSPRPLRPLR